MQFSKRRFRDKFNQIATFCIRRMQKPLLKKNGRSCITIFHDYEGAYAVPSKEKASYYGVTNMLDIEKQHGIKTTYTVVSKLFYDHPEIINRIVSEGHDIASHSYDHKVMTQLSKKQIDEDLMCNSLGLTQN